MKIWILNLVGLSLLGLLIEILLPSGTTNKYIKGTLSLVVIYVIISPIVSIFTDFNAGNIKNFISSDIGIDSEFITNYNIESNKYEEKFIEEILTNEGYKNVKVEIVSNIISQEKIEYVKVFAKDLVISEDKNNIDIKETIIDIVAKRLKIEKSRIYYE